jgi:hypothetical protein
VGFYAGGCWNADAGDLTNFDANLSALSHPGSGGYYDGDNWGGDIGFTVPFQTGETVGLELAAYALLLGEDGITVNTFRFGEFELASDGTFSTRLPPSRFRGSVAVRLRHSRPGWRAAGAPEAFTSIGF